MSDLDPPLLAAVSAGGAAGALTRYGIAEMWPHAPSEFPWAVWSINVTGCLLIGVLMTLAADRRLLRLFLGTGFLGGFTTFSTWAVDVQRAPFPAALLNVGATLLCALVAVWLGVTVTEAWTRRR